MTIIFKQVPTIQEQRKPPNITLPSPNSSLKLKGSPSGERLSLRRRLEKGNSDLTHDLT